MGETCNKTRILSVVVAVLVLVLAAVVAAFIYRETRNLNDKTGNLMQTELNENTVKDLYPGYFRSQEEQLLFDEEFHESFYFNRTVIQPTEYRIETCSFTCNTTWPPVTKWPPVTGRKKRGKLIPQISIGVHHGCCTSIPMVHAPTNRKNLKGDYRTFLQYGSRKQYFTVQSCTAWKDCTGCVCSSENTLVTAVVLKIGVKKVEYLNDTEIDHFNFAGCCKCVNT
ncbi:uncharacterized protein LOC127848348 isoform X2 [Dreissena polymorpha]|nr:uncharacterized protein LOC127848348 isoform X2 [Dreissena polymorpha]